MSPTLLQPQLDARLRQPVLSTAQQRAAYQAWLKGVQHTRARRYAQAVKAFRQATRQDPQVALYWLNLASVYHQLGQVDEAISCAKQAFELDRKLLLACHLAAELLRLHHRYSEMLQVLLSIDRSTQLDAQHHLLLGAAYMELARWQEAAVSFLQVLSMQPHDLQAYGQLGMALARLGRYADAAECYRTVAMLKPTAFAEAVYAAHYSAWACDWRQAAQDYERLEKARGLIEHNPVQQVDAFSPFCLLAMSDDAAFHRWAAALDAQRIAQQVRSLPQAAAFKALWERQQIGPSAYPNVSLTGPIRLGLVSSDFRTHATSILLVQVLELLDRSRFEIILYSHGPDDGSELRQRLVKLANKVVETAEISTVEQAHLVSQDGIHILVDFNGFTQGSRLGLFALRPAPIQVLWLAYPSTTGSDYIDYIIGDPILTPLEHQSDFSEHIAQLPVCYEPTDRSRSRPSPLTRSVCGLPEEAFVFACFNQSYKLTAELFATWAHILQHVPHSVLWLLVPQPDIQNRLREHMLQLGIDPNRLIFAPFVEPAQHMARLPCADLFLDTFPYGAHTTCNDALWMGLPVLSLQGRSFSARVAASLLHAVKLPELVCTSPQAYITRAIELATEPQKIADIRQHLDSNRLALPLFDSARFTHELAALLQRMVANWRQGLTPKPLLAEPIYILSR